MKTIRTKIVAIVLTFFLLIGLLFAVYSANTTTNYMQLKTDEVTKTVQYATERINKIIARMERNAIDLANSGSAYLASRGEEAIGDKIALDNFAFFQACVGGGIWFEPYAFRADTQRYCFYACADSKGAFIVDQAFRSPEYDYHTQSWYTEIKQGAAAKGREAVWTSPYIDDAGTKRLMTTVGSAILDEVGNFAGMSTVDWAIQNVVDELSKIRPTKNSFLLLASPQDDFILTNTYQAEHTDQAVNHAGEPLSGLSWFKEDNLPKQNEINQYEFEFGGVGYLSFTKLTDNGLLLSVQIPRNEIYSEIESRNNLFTLLIAGSMLGLLLISLYVLSALINKPIRKLTDKVQKLGTGDLDVRIDIHTKDEIGILAASFNKMTGELKESIEKYAQERSEKERISSELSIATQIQASMLPCIFPAFPDRHEFDIMASMLPAKEVGGDFYDFFLVDEEHLGIVMADVSGKGVPAALFMVITKTLIKNYAQLGLSPAQVFTKANNQLCDGNDAGMFVTAFMGLINIKTGEFRYANAGHNPPCIRKKDGAFTYMRAPAGFVLAGMEGIQYKENTLFFEPGDSIFLYTDGVTEATDGNNELFSDPRLLEVLNRHGDLPLAELLEQIKQEIDSFVGSAPQFDDITMLALTYRGDAGTNSRSNGRDDHKK